MNEEPVAALGTVNPVRDTFELLLARRAYDWQIPLLGICRGMQVLTVAFGGRIFQDQQSALPDRTLIKHSQQAPRSERSHSITTEPDSLLRRLLGERLFVNSFHHQSIADPGSRLLITATAPDGIVEAVESSERKSIIGVQWHPRVSRWRRHAGSFLTFRERSAELSPCAPLARRASHPRLALRYPNVLR